MWARLSIFQRLLVGIGGPLLVGCAALLVVIALRLDASNASQAEHFRGVLKERVEAELGGRVDIAFAILQTCHDETVAAGMADAAARATCAQRIKKTRFGAQQKSYFWIHTFDRAHVDQPRMVMHPTIPSLDGKDIADFPDRKRFKRISYRNKVYEPDAPEVKHIKTTNLFVDMNRAVVANGRGVVEYYWPDPGRDMEVGYAKMSVVRLFEPWGWVVGSGEYYDAIDAVAAHQWESVNEDNTTTSRILQLVALLLFAFIFGSILLAGRTLHHEVHATMGELARLRKAVEDGRLQERGDETVVLPEFRPLIKGTNAIIDQFHRPLTVINDYLAKLGRGEIPPRL